MLNLTRSGKPTIAAIMNFCVYPQMAITAIRVPRFEIGDVDERDARFLDNKESKALGNVKYFV